MKKFLLSAMAALAIAGTASAETATFNFVENGYGMTVTNENAAPYIEDGYTFSNEGVTVTIVENQKPDGTGAYNTARYWGTDGNATFRVMNGGSIKLSVASGVITEITATGANLNVITVDGFTAAADNSKTAITWTGSANDVIVTNDPAVSGTAQFKTLVVTYGEGTPDERLNAGLSFPEAKYEAVLGEAFTAPVLTKATTAAVTYSSDKETVATVDATTGVVTLVGAGTARITASAEANDQYKAGSASYLLTVTEPVVLPENSIYFSELGADFTFENTDIEVWKHDTRYGLKASAFVNSTVNAAVAKAISPVIDLTDYIETSLTFEQAFNNYKLNNQMISVDDFEGYAEIQVKEENGDWMAITEPTAPESFSWTFYANDAIDLSDFDGKKIQIAFVYISTDEVAGTWEVNTINVSGEKKTGIETVVANENAPVEYFNLQGVRVANPSNGLYIRRQGQNASKVYVR